ncbi:hypothetical protein WOLCODRAFT_137129 [Wolfiporia cocos MD-104 SS10]|uniref:Uncharacterized protein n=1 Tax=Wolfiporia cocos (strain MD-104) TaxID=742152 RepID=A0A2H3JT65_WOLCO|nr:hypothetical protein WOLCODRAFT_137129 [Wolfiporia cocos MD-104 SS10]
MSIQPSVSQNWPYYRYLRCQYTVQQGYHLMWIAFQFIESKIYVNSLLSLYLRKAERGWSDPERIKFTSIRTPIGLEHEHVTT